MNALKILLLLVAILATSADGQSQSTNTQTNKKDSGQTILRYHKKGSVVKRTPSRIEIELYYENNILSVQSTTVTGSCYIEFINDDNGLIVTTPNIAISDHVMIELESGIYRVHAHGDNGSEYYGEMVIE